ncbi:MAG TPA: phosphoserine phosphatase SerB [Burkholderiales bacterium]
MNLVAQGPALGSDEVFELARLAACSSFTEIASRAFRFRCAEKHPDVAAWCEERRIDHAWMPEGRKFSDLGLVAMDMDSTLITIECIDELGDLAGKKPEISRITAEAMRGEIDYPASLRKRVALLKDLEEKALLRVYEERLRLTPGAERLIAACKASGVKLLLVSGGFTFFTDRIKARLGFDYTLSNTLEVQGGHLTGKLLGDVVDADAKARKFQEVVTRLKIEKERSVAIGDGANDLKMMAEAGVSVAFHAKPLVRAQASCALDWSGLDAVVNLFE